MVHMNASEPKQAHWTCDDYGTTNLRTPAGGHIWMQARRPYCDRGHWEWGSTGLPHDPGITPSYYFMDLERGRDEIERWLGRVLGGEQAPCTLPQISGSFTREDGREAGWQWRQDGKRLVAEAGQVRLLLRPDPASGSLVMTADGIESLDDSDRFPRRYLDGATAVAEAEDFLAWRLLQHPTQIPGPLAHAPIPVSQRLAEQLQEATPKPLGAGALPEPGQTRQAILSGRGWTNGP